MSLLEISDLRVRTKRKELVHGIDLQIAPGEWFALIGESGSGKSLSAFSIANLLPRGLHRNAATLDFNGQDLLAATPEQIRKVRGHQIAYVFQDYHSAFSPYYRIGRQLDEVLVSHTDWERSRRLAWAQASLEALELPAQLLDRYPFQVSGGQLQRAALAAAMLLKPKLLIADEPTTALDAVNSALVLEQIAQIKEQQQCAVLFITHDLRVVKRYADRLAIMQHGSIRERGSTKEVFDSPKQQVTRNLISSIVPLRDIPARLPVSAQEATQ